MNGSEGAVALVLGSLSGFRRSVDDLAGRTGLSRSAVISALLEIWGIGSLREAKPGIEVDLNDFDRLCGLRLYSLR